MGLIPFVGASKLEFANKFYWYNLMVDMNLQNRFRLVIISIVALLVAVAGISSIGIWYTNVQIQQVIGMDEIVVNLYEIRILDSEYAAIPSERVAQQWQTKYNQIRNKLSKQHGMPDDVKDALNGLQQLFARFTFLSHGTPGMDASQKRLRNQIAATLNLESQRIIDWASDISRQTKDDIVPHQLFVGAAALAVMLCVAIAMITIMLITTRHIFSSVNRLKDGAEEIAGGKLGFQVEHTGTDEIATLATAINQMSRSLMDSYENLQEKTIQLEADVVERKMLQKVLEEKAVDLEAEIEQRRQVEEQLRESLEQVRRAVNTTVQVMVSAVEVRDPYTAGHQVRVANLARAIATEMKLSPDKIEGIRMAGSIHDIGKLSIPAEILSKPTKLSELEFSLIKEHARRGYEMLKDVESPWPLAEIVRQHHERMDGSGYPRNLKGEEICMEARILAVSDVVESMASHRPYRPGLGIDVALNEIEQNNGIFYDTAVVAACLRLFREKDFKLEAM